MNRSPSFCKPRSSRLVGDREKMSRRNIGNISVLHHEGESIDITQAMWKLCAKDKSAKESQTPVN